MREQSKFYTMEWGTMVGGKKADRESERWERTHLEFDAMLRVLDEVVSDANTIDVGWHPHRERPTTRLGHTVPHQEAPRLKGEYKDIEYARIINLQITIQYGMANRKAYWFEEFCHIISRKLTCMQHHHFPTRDTADPDERLHQVALQTD